MRRIPTTQLHVTAFHESGHVCAAVALKLKFTTVDIIPNEDKGRLGCVHQISDEIWKRLWDHTNPRVIKLVERQIVVDLAGAAAERRFEPRSNWLHGSKTDRENVDIWLQRLISGPPDADYPFEIPEGIEPFYDDEDWYPPHRLLDRKTLDNYHAKYSARATALVEQLWPKIQIVAAALLERKTLSYAEVCKLMTEARRIPRNKGTRK
jgi:hypothetical protein